MSESAEARLKRLHMRSMRRGIKEMDLILSAFATAHLADLSAEDIALYDRLLSENDHDLYCWIGGQFSVPGQYAGLIGRIAAQAQGVAQPD
ncbi:FAD assembly factor SdhE [Yoonia sp. 2307UL14-13]|uniref:FAD assembly factor SdhE n=1 Tax=Yoonia sp. 2307UL14-13 TaxID=3126506 RepID=UPI0030AF3E33